MNLAHRRLSGFEGDPENDRLAHGTEWILGGVPLASSSRVLPQSGASGGEVTSPSLAVTKANWRRSSSQNATEGIHHRWMATRIDY